MNQYETRIVALDKFDAFVRELEDCWILHSWAIGEHDTNIRGHMHTEYRVVCVLQRK